MDKETALAVEWLERRYDEWRIYVETSESYEVEYTRVDNVWNISDFQVSAYTAPMFTLKRDLPWSLTTDDSQDAVDANYHCICCTWKSMLDGSHAHKCYVCGRRIRHARSIATGYCAECEERYQRGDDV